MIRKLLSGLCAAALAGSATLAFAGLVPYTAGQGGVLNSPHNMNLYLPLATGGANLGNNQQQVCIFCHTPHNVPGTGQSGYNPLWNRELTQQTFLPYVGTDDPELGVGETLNALIDPADMMNGPSRLCMSCHDGTVAIDSYGGKTATPPLNPGDGGIIIGAPGVDLNGTPGGNLMNDHPIGFSYRQVSNADPNIRKSDANITWMPKSERSFDKISDVLYKGDKLTCASCHDVHNSARSLDKPLLLAKLNGSHLCLTCHDK